PDASGYGSVPGVIAGLGNNPGLPASLSIIGTTGSDTLVGSDQSNTWALTGTNSGQVAGITFSSFENLTGGRSDDTFQLAAGGSVGGKIDGGGGVNALDYSAWTTRVSVNLTTGTATAVGGGARNVRNVTGGSGDDVLVGDASNNVLMGGAGNDVLLGGAGSDTLRGGDGRDLLVGGTDADTLDGGADDDILIGGTIAYFDETTGAVNETALDAIMQEWTRTDLDASGALNSYNTRVGDLRGGGGLNGSYLLTPSKGHETVFDDLATDTLNCGAGLQWIFPDPH